MDRHTLTVIRPVRISRYRPDALPRANRKLAGYCFRTDRPRHRRRYFKMTRDLRTIIATWTGDTMAVMSNYFLLQELQNHRHDRAYCRFLRQWKRSEPDEFSAAPLLPMVSQVTMNAIQREWRNRLRRRRERPPRLTPAERDANTRRIARAYAAVHSPVSVPGTTLRLTPPRSVCMEGYAPQSEETDDSDSDSTESEDEGIIQVR